MHVAAVGIICRVCQRRSRRGEITHRGNALIQRIVSEHARIVPLRERQAARKQFNHLHGVKTEILIAGHLRDDIQRLFAGHGIGIAGHGVHVHAHGLNQVFQIVEALIVSICDVANESRGHFHCLGELADSIQPTCAYDGIADHRVHAGKRLRIKMERWHVDSWNLHAGIGAFGCGHHGGDGIEIPLHGHTDYHVRVGKLCYGHIIAVFGIFLTGLADHVVP